MKMDLEESDFTSQAIGDAQLMNNLPKKNELIKSGLIGSITFCDGKSIKSLFDFMTTYTDFIMEFHPQGLIIKQCLMHKPNVYDTVSYMVFKGNKQCDYNFYPENIPGEGTKDYICVKVNSATVFGYVKKNKATTSIIFQLKNNSPTMMVNVINGITTLPYFLPYTLVPMITYNIPGTITDPNIIPNMKPTSELFSSAMINMGVKHENVLYDFKLNIYKEGISFSTNAPGVGSIPYGNIDGSFNKFSLKNQVSKRLAKLCKISQRTPVGITCLDNTLFKISINVGSYSEMVIYQFPDPDASDNMSQYNQYMMQYGAQMQQGNINPQMLQYQQQLQLMQNQQMQLPHQQSSIMPPSVLPSVVNPPPNTVSNHQPYSSSIMGNYQIQPISIQSVPIPEHIMNSLKKSNDSSIDKPNIDVVKI